MNPLEGIESGAQLGKYRVEQCLGDGERALLRAVEADSGKNVCLIELEPDEVALLTPATRVKHAHLVRVLEVLEHGDRRFLVFEHVAGTTLTARLAEIGKKPTVEAVGSALRVSDALWHLHEAGGVHGFLHTDSVVLDPPERLGPVLTFAPVPSDERAFHSPERGESGEPSVADDAWAAAGLLHMMLTGKPPPKDGYETTEEIERAGVDNRELREALLHGLHRDATKRSRDVRPLKRELARWFVEHAGHDPGIPHHSTQPPPLPSSAAPPRSQPASRPASSRVPAPTPAKSRRARVLLLAAIGSLVGLGGAWAVSAFRGPKVTLVERPVASAAAAPLPRPIDLSDVAVTAEEQDVDLDKTASCVAGYLPKGAFAKSPDLSWLCEETDAQKGAQKLRVAVVTAAPKTGGPTDAMKLFSRITWYEMAVHAVVRAGCCIDAKPLTLPEPGQGCERMADALSEIGRDVVANKSYDEPLARFGAAIQCETNLGRGGLFGRTARPQPGEEAAFRELVDAIAH